MTPERAGYAYVSAPTIALKDGERITDFKLEMTSQPVISGRVVDEHGDPLQGVPIEARASVKERNDVADTHRDSPEPPQQTFTDSPHAIADGTRRVEFYHFGWAHTREMGWSICRASGCSARAMRR